MRCMQLSVASLHLKDVSDPDTLQSVETAVRENGSLRKIAIHTIPSYDSRQALHTRINVAVAILKGAAKNESLRTLNLSIPHEPVPAPELVAEVRRLNSKLQLTIRAGKSESEHVTAEMTVVHFRSSILLPPYTRCSFQMWQFFIYVY